MLSNVPHIGLQRLGWLWKVKRFWHGCSRMLQPARVRWGQSTNGTNISYRMNTTAMNNWTYCSMLHKFYSVHYVLLNEHSVQCIFDC